LAAIFGFSYVNLLTVLLKSFRLTAPIPINYQCVIVVLGFINDID